MANALRGELACIHTIRRSYVTEVTFADVNKIDNMDFALVSVISIFAGFGVILIVFLFNVRKKGNV